MLIAKLSPFTGKTNVLDIPVTDAQLSLWSSGVLIQDAMPNLTPDEREFIMTGITPDEWEAAFGGES